MLSLLYFCIWSNRSDKSYSIVDYGNNKGIVLISCEDIFNGINENNDPNLYFEIEVIMLEIYN